MAGAAARAGAPFTARSQIAQSYIKIIRKFGFALFYNIYNIILQTDCVP